MDTKLDLTTTTVDADAPRFDIMKNKSLDDDILEVSEYQGTAHAYSSYDDVCVSDHPSEDPSDLALAERDESFPLVPQMVGRTSLSFEESFAMALIMDVEDMINEIARYANAIDGVENWNVDGGSDEPNDEVDDDGYASIEDNIDDNNDVEATRMFEVTDLVPICRAQELFLMAWNGESSSCGEDVGDIETLGSESESGYREYNDAGSGGDDGSVHTLNSSEDLGDANAENGECTDGMAHIETAIASRRCITAHVMGWKDARESHTSTETAPSATLEGEFVQRVGVKNAGDVSAENFSEHNIDPKISVAKKRQVFKRLRKLFASCFGR